MTRTAESPPPRFDTSRSSLPGWTLISPVLMGLSAMSLVLAGATGCATVDVTKTAKGFYAPTRPDDVEILMTRPSREFIELATVSTTNWDPKETAKMHNAMRAKSAPLGAHAVVITDSGVVVVQNSSKLWSTGFALRYNAPDAGAPVPDTPTPRR